jgi:L-lactate dehydrogenase complex protein LldE
MTVGLFVPCYIEQFYPQVAVASLELLERSGCDVSYPRDQTCCGQPMANAGYETATAEVARHFARCFGSYDYVVAPSGSCVAHVRTHYAAFPDTPELRHVRERTYELCQFLHAVLGVRELGAAFPQRVALHHGCHGLRMLGLAQPSELLAPACDRVRALLAGVAGLELVPLERADECCGFGGSFAVSEPAVSVAMGEARLQDFLRSGAEVITSTDMSCLMHLDGLVRRQRLPLRVLHVAEILNARAA